MKKIILTTVIFLVAGSNFTSIAQSETYLRNRILIEGLYIRNLGNFGEVWANSTGGYIGYSIAFPEHNLLIMRTGLISNSLKEQYKDDENYKDATSTIIPVEIGGRYYFIDSRFMPFVQFINGLNIVFENTNLEGKTEDKTLVKYGWQIGLGLTINLLSNLSFDFGAHYQSNFYQHDAMNTGFEYNVGVGFAL